MFKHGEVIYKRTWFRGYRTMISVPFRFRYDSVPGIHKCNGSYFKAYYKTPRTTNEQRFWYASEGYGRRKRSPLNLPNTYDDFPRADRYYDSSWKKNKLRRQWMKKNI